MTVKIKIPAQLRTLTQGVDLVEASGGTVGEVLTDLGGRYTEIAPRIFDEAGELRRFVNVYVGDEDIRFTEGLATQVPEGGKVTILPAVAGG
jgi:molybdopterin converting factor small subunit